MSDMLIALGVFGAILIVSTLAALTLCGLLYRDYQVPPPWRLAAGGIGRGLIDTPSNALTIMRRLGAQLPKSYDIDLGGNRHAGKSLVIRLATDDFAELRRQGHADELAGWAVEAYERTAARCGWKNPPSGSMTVYVLVDESLPPNHPRISTGAPSERDAIGTTVQIEGPTIAWTAGSALDVTKPYLEAVADHAGNAGQGERTTTWATWRDDFFKASETVDRTLPISQKATVLRDGRVVCNVTEAGVRIGRASSNDLVIADRSVSRVHARIRVEHGDIVLVPEPGRYCEVNGVPINGPTTLHPGDRMAFAGDPQPYTLGKVAA